jgi:large subunit ribosomal protein L17
MRHKIAGRKLGRDTEHRLAMRRNMVASLFQHERISTTMEKAKEVRRFAEKLITLAKKGDLAARRRAISLLGSRDIIAEEEGKAVRKGTIVGRLFSEIAPRYLDRSGGYTRIVRLAMNRLGDNGQVVLLQLVGEEKAEKEKTKKKSSKRARRAAAFAGSAEARGTEAAKVAKKKKRTAAAADEEIGSEQAGKARDEQVTKPEESIKQEGSKQ